jgi:UDP-3-O-[3-hydroxymyristoyl] glucosamine N-acyltransferase
MKWLKEGVVIGREMRIFEMRKVRLVVMWQLGDVRVEQAIEGYLLVLRK